MGLTPTPLPRARCECPDPGAAGRRRLRPALRRAHRFPWAAGPPARDPSCPSGDGLGRPAALRCPRVAGEPVPRGPSAPVGRPVGRSDRSGGGCSAASRSNRASPPPSRHSALAPATVSRTPPPRGWTDTRVPGLLGSLRWKGRRTPSRVLASPRSAVPPPRPPPRPAPRHSGLLPSASNLPKRRQLTLGLSYFLAIFWGFFGAIPAWRSARTGYPFRPARLMRSGITRKWRRKRCGSSFKFVRANPAAPGHAGNAGSLHSWPPFPRLPPRPCCACGKLPHTPTPTSRTCAETSWRQALTSSVPVPRVLRVRVCASVVLVPPWRCSPFRHHSGDTSSPPLGGNKLGSILSVSLKTKQKSNKTLL